MYATVRVYESHELADRLAEHADEINGLLSAIDGFQSYYLIRTGTGTASVTVYETEAATAESNAAAAGWIKENLPDYAGSPPQVSAGEVVLDF